MKALKCDRCGKFYDRFSLRDDGDEVGCKIVPDNYYDEKKDICPECYKQLEEWICGGELKEDKDNE